MLFSNTDGRTYAKETPRSVLLDICYSWNKKRVIFHSSNRWTREKYLLAVPPADSVRVCAWNLGYTPHCCQRSVHQRPVTETRMIPRRNITRTPSAPFWKFTSKLFALIYLSLLNWLDNLPSFYKLVLHLKHGWGIVGILLLFTVSGNAMAVTQHTWRVRIKGCSWI